MREIELKSGKKWPVNTAYCGDNMEFLEELPDNCLDSIVTDGPYGINFMGKKWDYDVPSVKFWEECLRVLKPGGHILSFSSTKTYHRMAVNVEDAGFEIRDMISWVYGSGFPKSHNISKALDSIAGVEREVIGQQETHDIRRNVKEDDFNGQPKYGTGAPPKRMMQDITAPSTDEAKQWDGWGTALKPAVEPIVLARKPLSEKTVAQNVLKWGVGGINIDDCRVEYSEDNPPIPQLAQGKTEINGKKTMYDGNSQNKSSTKAVIGGSLTGRFPANFIHDGSEEVEEIFPQTKSGPCSTEYKSSESENRSMSGKNYERFMMNNRASNEGSASRFFYVAKPSSEERGKDNKHPTVKPIALMRYLIRLVTPKEGITADFFLGSFTTAIAAHEENIDWIGAEKPEKDHGHFKDGHSRYMDKTKQIMLDF